jgi:sugar lactone lactonase YvrE
MPNCEIELLVDAKAEIGESPLWVAEQNALYWIDVKAPALHRTTLGTRATETWELPSEIGGYALKPDGLGAVVALRGGVLGLCFADGKLEQLCDPPFDPLTHRFNEGDCDPHGRLWLGTMFDPKSGGAASPTGDCLYCFTLAAGLARHDNQSLLHNGFAWSRNGDEFFLAHSREGRIEACEFDVTRGTLGRKRTFTVVPKDAGVPDGGALDQDGFYWSAIHGGGRLHRYARDGSLDRIVELPITNPTMMAFCGSDLSHLCVTSATHGKPGKPFEGGVLICRPGVRGHPREYIVC